MRNNPLTGQVCSFSFSECSILFVIIVYLGVLACEDNLGIFQGVGVFSIHNYMATSLFTPFNDVLSFNTVMEVGF